MGLATAIGTTGMCRRSPGLSCTATSTDEAAVNGQPLVEPSVGKLLVAVQWRMPRSPMRTMALAGDAGRAVTA